jgi:hypothetical protein
MKAPSFRSLLIAGGLAFGTIAFAQTPKLELPAPSPACTVKQHVGLTDIEIVYSRPSMKGRTIFGGVVPYNEVWRVGANASTKISFSTPVKLNGNDVPAGKYALYAIPGEKDWTIIIHKDTSLFGAFGYKQENDLVRFHATPVPLAEHVETFTIDCNDLRDESATLYLLWDQTLVPIKVEMDVASKLLPQIEAAMASTEKKSAGMYYQAASFYFNHDQDLKKALTWVDAGLVGKPMIAFELLNLKAQILAKQGDKAGAIAAAKESTELALKFEGPNSAFARMNQELISKLQ